MVSNGVTSRIIRRELDGSADSTFGSDGELFWPRHIRRMLVDENDRIYLVGNTATQGIVERYLPSGALDTTYGSNGSVMMTFTDTMDFTVLFHDADIYSDGRLIICGGTSQPDDLQANSSRSIMFRLNEHGDLDETFLNDGMVTFYGQISYGINLTYETPCTSHLRYSCPMVKIGHMEEIYLVRQKMWWHNCSPSGPHRDVELLRFLPNDLDPQDTSIFYSYNLWAAIPTVILPSFNGYTSLLLKASNGMGSSYMYSFCRDMELGSCSPAVSFHSISSEGNAITHHKRGVLDAQGHMLHVANWVNYGGDQLPRLSVQRTTNYDLSPDPDWGVDGYIVLVSLSVTDRTGLAMQQDGKLLVAATQNMNGVSLPVVIRLHNIPDPRACIRIDLMLGGPYDPFTGRMNDQLRAAEMIPQQDPYTMAGSVPVLSPPSQFLDPGLLAVSGDSAVVDWVWLDIMPADDPTQVVSAKAALILANGTVNDTYGKVTVDMNCGAGQYYLRIRHRNHLAVTLAEPITLGADPISIDLTDPATPTFGTNAQKEVNGVMMLWPGDANGDGVVKYVGAGNDRNPLLIMMNGVPTSTISGYHLEDINMDGVVKYVGAGNDRDIILQTIGGAVPTAVRVEQGP